MKNIISNFIIICWSFTFLLVYFENYSIFYVEKYVFRNMVGILGFWGFIGHIFYSKRTAKSIGWSSNGFQFEVGMCNLAIGICGIISSLDTLLN